MRCYNPDPWEAEAEASQVQVQPGLQGPLVKISKANNEIVLLFLERFHHKHVLFWAAESREVICVSGLEIYK